MKKINVFFGVSVLLVGMGAAAAVKALVVVAPDYIRYPTSNLPNPSYACVVFTPTMCDQTTGNVCTEAALNPYTGSNGFYRIYETKTAAGNCSQELYKAVF